MTAPDMFDLDAWITGARRPERVAKVFSRPDLAADLSLAQAELDAATDDRVRTQLRKRVRAIRDELEGSAHTFRFRALSQDQADEVDAQNPIPSKDKADDAALSKAANQRLFAMLATQAIDPPMTTAQVTALYAAVGDVEFAPIIEAATSANSEATVDAPFWRATSQGDQT